MHIRIYVYVYVHVYVYVYVNVYIHVCVYVYVYVYIYVYVYEYSTYTLYVYAAVRRMVVVCLKAETEKLRGDAVRGTACFYQVLIDIWSIEPCASLFKHF